MSPDDQLERRIAGLQALLDACTAIGARRTFGELAQSIAFEAFRLIRRDAAITVYAARQPGAAPELVAVAGRSSRVAPDGTELASDDEVDEVVRRALQSRETMPAGGASAARATVVPLSADAGERAVGAILAEAHGDARLAEDAVALLRAFADHAAAALDNLNRSEERLRIADEQGAIVEHLGDGVLVLDSELRVVDANPAAKRMLASWSLASEDEVQSPSEWSVARLDGSALPTAELPGVGAVREGRSLPQRSLILRTPAGDRILSMSAEPLHHDETAVDGAPPSPTRAAMLVFRDMTRQIAVLTELERRVADLTAENEAFRRYARALAQLDDGVVITSPGGRVEEWLGGASRLFGVDAPDTVGRAASRVLQAVDDAESFERALGHEAGWSREVVLRRRDGSRLAALVTSSLVRDDAGTLVARLFLVKERSEPRGSRDSFARPEPERPRSSPPSAPAVPPAEVPRTTEGPALDDAATRRRRILVVEDEPDLRKAYRRILGAHYDVVVVGAGDDALGQLRAARFDLVLCDLQMPGMSGADLFDQSLAEGVTAADRFLFVTGGAFTPQTKEFAQAHGDKIVLKPFEVAVLLQRIERQLAR